MALKVYEYKGGLWQYEEGKQPAGAVEHVRKGAKVKARRPKNKAAKKADK